MNGAAAHLTREGHTIIVASFGAYDESDLENYSPIAVHVDDRNEIAQVTPTRGVSGLAACRRGARYEHAPSREIQLHPSVSP